MLMPSENEQVLDAIGTIGSVMQDVAGTSPTDDNSTVKIFIEKTTEPSDEGDAVAGDEDEHVAVQMKKEGADTQIIEVDNLQD